MLHSPPFLLTSLFIAVGLAVIRLEFLLVFTQGHTKVVFEFGVEVIVFFQSHFLDCVGNLFKLSPYDKEVSALNEIVILAGNGLPAAKSIRAAIKWYPDKVISFERKSLQ